MVVGIEQHLHVEGAAAVGPGAHRLVPPVAREAHARLEELAQHRQRPRVAQHLIITKQLFGICPICSDTASYLRSDSGVKVKRDNSANDKTTR